MAVYQALLLNTVVPQIQAAQAGDSYVMVVNATTDALRITQTGTGNALVVEDSANPDATPFVVTATGNVGVGATTPAYNLDVSGGTGASGAVVGITTADNPASGRDFIRLIRSGVGTAGTIEYSESNAIGITGTSSVVFKTASVERMRLDASGNLGLGVTPSAWRSTDRVLQVNRVSLYDENGNSMYLGHNFFENSSGQYIYLNSDFASYYQQIDSQHRWYTAPSGTAGNAITFTQAMTLDASGNLLVGTTTSDGSRLRVSGAYQTLGDGAYEGLIGKASTIVSGGGAGQFAIRSASDLLFATNGNSERARITSGGDLLLNTVTRRGSARQTIYQNSLFITGDGLAIQDGGATTGGAFIGFFDESGTKIGSVSRNAAATVAYNTSSDYRLKDNPQPLENSGSFIDALKPKTWNWKSDGSKGVGFIAHEVQEVSPGTVLGAKDAVDADGKPVMQAMEYGSAEFIANIVAELQSLRARVAQLEAK